MVLVSLVLKYGTRSQPPPHQALRSDKSTVPHAIAVKRGGTATSNCLSVVHKLHLLGVHPGRYIR